MDKEVFHTILVDCSIDLQLILYKENNVDVQTNVGSLSFCESGEREEQYVYTNSAAQNVLLDLPLQAL